MENNKNRIKVNIAGTRFTVVSTETQEYTEGLADKLNAEIAAVQKAAPGLSLASAVMLASLNICDSMAKAQADADRLRKQIKEYLSDSAKYRSEYEKTAEENEKLRKDLELYRRRLGERGHRAAEPAPLSPAVRSVQRSSDSEEAAADELSGFAPGDKNRK